MRILEFFSTSATAMVSRVRTFTRRLRSFWIQPTHDWGRSDYGFWRRAYFARAKGLEISGLFIKPLVNKVAAWSFGQAPEWRCESDKGQELLIDWWSKNHPAVLKAFQGSLKQGDEFVVVNSDLTVTVVRPDNVEPLVDPTNFGKVVGWRVVQVIDHPTETRKMTMIDEYTLDGRVHRVEIDSAVVEEIFYPNLLERLPIIHIPNLVQDGEVFGHSEAEGLLSVLHRYGEVFEAAIEGNITQGRPTPVLRFEREQDLDKFWAMYGETETATMPDGRVERIPTLSVDLSQLLTISGGEFDYKSPEPFSADTAKLLELMFYLILEHTELPEFVMGNAIASSKASAETQMPVFEKFIEGKRSEMAGWLVDLTEVVLGYLSLTEPGVPVERPTLQWKKLTQDGRLTLDTITWAYTEGLLDRRTALMLAPVDVENIDDVLDKADEESKERQGQLNGQGFSDEDEFNRDLENQINSLEFLGE